MATTQPFDDTGSTLTLKVDVVNAISDALKKHACRDAAGITIAVAGCQVLLVGEVDSWAVHQAAVEAAWSTPGVKLVVDHILVVE